MSSSENGFGKQTTTSSNNSNGSSLNNSSNSFYASFKIYINKFSGGGGSNPQQAQQQPKPILRNPNSKIVRIERIECVDDSEDSVFFEPTTQTQNVEVQIKVDPPPSKPDHPNKENSPVFYLEPDDWPEDKSPPMVTSPTRALSPCGCGKSHAHHMTHMESLPEEVGCHDRSPTLVRGAFSTSSSMESRSPPVRSSSGTYLTLPSPRAAIMSEIMQGQSQKGQHQRQRKIAIPVLCARAVNSAVRTF